MFDREWQFYCEILRGWYKGKEKREAGTESELALEFELFLIRGSEKIVTKVKGMKERAQQL